MHIEEVVTILGVNVDSVCTTIWRANSGGIKNILANDIGVRILWNLGETFVPWSNVRYTKGR